MGNPISKLQSDKNKLNSSVSKDVKEIDEQFKLDPRSPSADISRTPVQLRSPKRSFHQKITKQQNLNESMHTPTRTKGMLNTLLRNRLGAHIDLRSPSANIERTPIQLDRTIDSESKVILEDVTDSFTCMTLDTKYLLEDSVLDLSLPKESINNDDGIMKLDEIAQDADEYINSETPVESEPVEIKIDSKNASEIASNICEKRKSYLGVLETNMDCLETDLDKVRTIPKLRKASYVSTSVYEQQREHIDPRSPAGDLCTTTVVLPVKSEYSTPICENKLTIVNEMGDPRSVTREISRTPIVLPESQDATSDLTITHDDLNKSPGDENILNEKEIQTKLALKSTKLDEIRQDFAKKYGKNIKSDPVNQVYEDAEFHKVTPRKTISSTGRTPLSCVRNKPSYPRSKSDDTKDKKKSENRLMMSNDLINARTPLSCVRNIDRQPRFNSSNSTPESKKTGTHLTMVNDLSGEVLPRSIPSITTKLTKGLSKIPTLQQRAVNNVVINNLQSETENSLVQLGLKPCDWDKDSSVVI